MSLKNKFFSIVAVGLGVVMFSTFTMAQDKNTKSPEKSEKHEKGERGFGKGNFDRKGHEGRRGHRRMRGGMKGGMRGDMMHGARGINLTDAQKEQIKAFRQANRPNEAMIVEFRSLMQAKRVGTLTAEQTSRAKELMNQRTSNAKALHAQIQNILTAEQKAQIEQKKLEMKLRMEERKQNRKQRTDKPRPNPVIN